MHLSSVQTWLTKQVTQQLSQKLHTKVDIKRVHFSFFYQLELEDLLINDRSGDTLLFAGAAKVNVNDWFFSKDHIVLKYIGLNSGLINLKRKTTT